MIRFCFAVLLFCALSVDEIQAQGCSDSGFCSMGAIRSSQSFFKDVNFKLRSIELNYHYGRTKFRDNIWATTLEGNFSMGKKNMLQFRVPYIRISGALGAIDGLGDVAISFTRIAYATENNKIAFVIGTRLPAHAGNRVSKAHGIQLPSYYQTSMGTFDAVVGASWINKDWLFATGLQIPIGRNKNDFFWGLWKQTELYQTVHDYPIAREINRGNDLMFRIERKYRYRRWTGYIGFLGIYRLNMDSVLPNDSDTPTQVEGTNGLASNAVFALNYSLNAKNHVKLLVGKKINERRVTLDGLQREYIAQLNYEFRF